MGKRDTFVKVYDNIDDHPGFMAVSTESLGLWLKALVYCSRNRTDGIFPSRAVDRWHDSDSDAPAQLVTAGRWHLDGHECSECPQPPAGSLYLHGYLAVNKSATDIEESSEKRRAAGARGGVARARNLANAKQDAKQTSSNLKQAGSNFYPEAEADTEVKSSRARKRATQLPNDFTPNDTNRRIATERGLDLDAVIAQWSDYHRAKGSTFKDWHAALNTWLRRENPRPTTTATPDRIHPMMCPTFEEHTERHTWTDKFGHTYMCLGANG